MAMAVRLSEKSDSIRATVASYLLASVLAALRHSRVSVAYKLRRSLAQLHA